MSRHEADWRHCHHPRNVRQDQELQRHRFVMEMKGPPSQEGRKGPPAPIQKLPQSRRGRGHAFAIARTNQATWRNASCQAMRLVPEEVRGPPRPVSPAQSNLLGTSRRRDRLKAADALKRRSAGLSWNAESPQRLRRYISVAQMKSEIVARMVFRRDHRFCFGSFGIATREHGRESMERFTLRVVPALFIPQPKLLTRPAL